MCCTQVVIPRGVLCEENTNDCASSPCVNGRCVDDVAAYTCVCNPVSQSIAMCMPICIKRSTCRTAHPCVYVAPNKNATQLFPWFSGVFVPMKQRKLTTLQMTGPFFVRERCNPTFALIIWHQGPIEAMVNSQPRRKSTQSKFWGKILTSICALQVGQKVNHDIAWVFWGFRKAC